MTSYHSNALPNVSGERTVPGLLAVAVAAAVCLGFVAPVTAVGSADATPASLDGVTGSGTQDDPYRLTNATELQAMRDDPDAHYVLANDVDASATANWNRGEGFEPVGSDSPFTGTFDGRNHTITGLTVDRPTADDVGLFGAVDGATIEHVSLAGVDVRAGGDAGALVGIALGSSGIHDASASGTVTGGDQTGGLVGILEASSLSDAHANVEVDGKSNTGGLVGLSSGSTVDASSASGNVAGTYRVGGLVGGPTNPVNADANTITRTYATGAVSGSEAVGGLLGGNVGAVERSYATGDVSGDAKVGGLIGHNRGDAAALYWNGEAAGDAVGEGSTAGTSLTADETVGASASSAMNALTFGQVWVTTDETPVLRSEVEAVSLSIPDQIIVDRGATATVQVSLRGDRTVGATEAAAYDVNRSVLSIDGGRVDTSGTGSVDVTATVADRSDSATVSVVTPPDVSVDSSGLRYDRVGAETAAPVDVTLRNDGGADGEFDLSLSINGTVGQTRTVVVPGHGTETVQFNWSAPATGTYQVALNGSSLGTLTVVDEPETSVASATSSEELLAVGNATTVEATLENAGDAAAGHTVELTANGETVATKDVVVPADGTTVSFEYTADSAGEYDLAVGGTSAGTLTVAELGSVSVDGASVPESVGAGERYEVTVTLTNSGGLALSTDVTYSVGGSSVATETVEVPADGAAVTFEATAPEAGESIEHAVSAGDDEWTGTTSVDVATATATPGTGGDGSGGDSTESEPDGDGGASTTSGDGAGFGIGAVVGALAALAVAGRRRTN
ncbi:CARDB domain-containing protein [Halosimplex amylolyticum]|uniref:CARDB domain-containing protein n=1 Tax=Halosimplex amylolyticum TaxID=3396616 RepID=UPI003F54FCA2